MLIENIRLFLQEHLDKPAREMSIFEIILTVVIAIILCFVGCIDRM